MPETIFASKDFDSAKVNNLQIDNYETKIVRIKKWQESITNGRIFKQKEEQLQWSFLETFFGEALDYQYEKHETVYQLENEFKSFTDGKKPDGALGYFRQSGNENSADVRAVIELERREYQSR